MSFYLFSAEIVDLIHDEVLNPGELPGRARDKSLEGALARVENRLVYGMIDDVYDLAAAYAVVISTGHCFNDGNKRTAFRSLQTCLELHDITLNWTTEDIGQTIIRTAQGLMNETELADYLRKKAQA